MKFTALPLHITYQDKLELARTLLGVYSVTVRPLTDRDKDLLAMCMLYDMNSKDFKDKVIGSGLGIQTKENITTMFSRLKDKGLVYRHPVKKKREFNPILEGVNDLVNNHDNVVFQVVMKKQQ